MVIGVTGSFCSGKSQLLKILEKKGCRVLDVDDIASSLLSSNKKIADRVKDTFNLKGIKPGADLKKELRKVVFKDAGLLSKLEKILHPEIIKVLKKKVSSFSKKTKLLFVEVPLLFEAGLRGLFDQVVVVYAPQKLSLARAKKKKFTRQQAVFILKKQMSSREKVKLADFVVRNSGSLKDLEKAAGNLLEQITLKCSKARLPKILQR